MIIIQICPELKENLVTHVQSFTPHQVCFHEILNVTNSDLPLSCQSERAHAITAVNQSELAGRLATAAKRGKTCNRQGCKARENVQVTVGFSFFWLVSTSIQQIGSELSYLSCIIFLVLIQSNFLYARCL